jgi:flagellar biosynthesis protein FlhF
MPLFDFSAGQLEKFPLILTRVAGLDVGSPFFGHGNIPVIVKVGFIGIFDDARDQQLMMANLIGCDSAHFTSPSELNETIKGISNGLVIIDTSGISMSGDFKLKASLVNAANPHETHLVVPADFSAPDLERLIKNTNSVSVDKLLFTKLDETRCRGGVFSVAQDLDLNFSYQCSSREIPGIFGTFDPGASISAIKSFQEDDEKSINSLEVVGW